MAERPKITVLCAPDVTRWPGLDALNSTAQVTHVNTPHGLAEAINDAEVLVATDFRTALLQEVWPRARRLKWIHATSAGVDTLMFPELVNSEVTMTNAQGVFDDAIAEYVLGLVLSFAKDIPSTLRDQQQRRWRHRDTERIAGKSALIVGAGSIGRAIARVLTAMGMKVDGVARTARSADPDFRSVYEASALMNLLPDSDYVVIAAPLTPETRGMLNEEAFQRMKPRARLINIGRGPIVDTEALVEALKQGRIAGAALDVFEEEPLPEEHPLWHMPQVIVSPHMAGDVFGWRESVSRQFLENFERWLQGQRLAHVVDKRRGYAFQGG